jgi:hypothetical protein
MAGGSYQVAGPLQAIDKHSECCDGAVMAKGLVWDTEAVDVKPVINLSARKSPWLLHPSLSHVSSKIKNCNHFFPSYLP